MSVAAPGPAARQGLNWLAFELRPFLGALLGAAAGGGIYAALLPEREAIWAVGLGLGLGCAMLARDASFMRGVVLGAAALWASALAQCFWLPLSGRDSFLGELLAFHTTLDAPRLLQHALGCLLGGWLAARSLFHRGRRRLAGA